MYRVDPLARQISEGGEVHRTGQPFGLEAPHLAGRGRPTHRCSAADYPTHRRIATQPLGVVHVLVTGQPPEYRLPQQSDQQVPPVPAGARLRQSLATACGQSERVVRDRRAIRRRSPPSSGKLAAGQDLRRVSAGIGAARKEAFATRNTRQASCSSILTDVTFAGPSGMGTDIISPGGECVYGQRFPTRPEHGNTDLTRSKCGAGGILLFTWPR